jgi:hypothetical protein
VKIRNRSITAAAPLALASAIMNCGISGIGQRGMMLYKSLRPFGSLGSFSRSCLGQFGGIPEIPVVDIDVLCDHRLDAAANAISGLSFRNPDWCQQLVDVAGLDFRRSRARRSSRKRTVSATTAIERVLTAPAA